ncbi:MAG: hypothetical protein ABL921_17100 [Pirellula sp.]
MADLPIQFPYAAHDWTNLTEAALNSRLEDPSLDQAKIAAHWDDPDDPQWSILLAHQLMMNGTLAGQLAGGPRKHATIEQFMQNLIRWFRQANHAAATEESWQLQHLVLAQQVALLYSKLHGNGLQRVEGSLLQVLFASGHTTAVKLGVDYLLTIPPSNWADVSLALTPLVQSKNWSVEDVFPKLLQSSNPSVLSPALDVANHYFRSRTTTQHPAAVEFNKLLTLLGGLANQLGMLEENPRSFGDSVAAIQKMLFDSVSLAVSLCDTLGLIGKPEAIGKLNQALRLSHRRIQTEAAFALAKLGDKHGEQKIVELASDFTCRQRAVAYAEELGIDERIDERWTTATAIAESRLANWLTQNEQMGIPPARMELIDQRTLYWPGFDQPQECFLFRFEYDMQDSVFSNLGLSGPMCNTFSDDLANISIDDAYAIFAGWDIDHPDVYELLPEALLPSQRLTVHQLLSDVKSRFDQVEILFFGVFLEHQSILARGQNKSESRVFVYDGERFLFEPFPKPDVADPKLTYLLWRGRLFLELSNYTSENTD